MSKDTLILLAIGVAAYWFLFRKVEAVQAKGVPVNTGTNPTAGKTQEASNDIFQSVLDIIKGGLDAFNNSAAQSSADRNG